MYLVNVINAKNKKFSCFFNEPLRNTKVVLKLCYFTLNLCIKLYHIIVLLTQLSPGAYLFDKP